MERKMRTLTRDQIVQYAQPIQAVQMSEPEDGLVTVTGEAARYGNWFLVAEYGKVRIQRRNNPGMFARSLSQSPEVVLRIDHQIPLARTGAGTLKVWETEQALMFEGQVNTKTSAGSDLVENMKSGLYTQGSVQYWPLKDYPLEPEWQDDKYVEYQDIAEGKLHQGDVTICVMGMNPQCNTTLAQAKTIAEDLELIRQAGLLEDQEEGSATPKEPDLDYGLLKQREAIRLHYTSVAGIPILQQATTTSPSETSDAEADADPQEEDNPDIERKEENV